MTTEPVTKKEKKEKKDKNKIGKQKIVMFNVVFILNATDVNVWNSEMKEN